jgi:hypothetical protein
MSKTFGATKSKSHKTKAKHSTKGVAKLTGSSEEMPYEDMPAEVKEHIRAFQRIRAKEMNLMKIELRAKSILDDSVATHKGAVNSLMQAQKGFKASNDLKKRALVSFEDARVERVEASAQMIEAREELDDIVDTYSLLPFPEVLPFD